MALDWDKLRVFHAAAEAGSFTHAAETLHLSQSRPSSVTEGINAFGKACRRMIAERDSPLARAVRT